MIDIGLDGKVAIVTGANHGIGAATARSLSEQGVRVFVTYLRIESQAGNEVPGAAYRENRARSPDKLVDEIRRNGGDIEAWEADLSDAEVIPELFDRAEAALGPVDILIHNAAAWAADTFAPVAEDGFGRPLRPVTAASHDLHFAVNSRATALLIAEYSRRYVSRGANWGRIVGITTGGSRGFPEEVSYGASKNALESYTMAAAMELGKFRVTANVVCPPATDTGWIPDQARSSWDDAGPLRRIAQPEHVAGAIVLLVSEQAGSITGNKILVW
ncbi:MAG: SDR family NAD(P)-dependent oxidoreductase [Chloroflexota bacterium]